LRPLGEGLRRIIIIATALLSSSSRHLKLGVLFTSSLKAYQRSCARRTTSRGAKHAAKAARHRGMFLLCASMARAKTNIRHQKETSRRWRSKYHDVRRYRGGLACSANIIRLK